MQGDPILREVHKMKDRLARDVGYDVQALFDRLREAASKHPERMLGRPSGTDTPNRRGTPGGKR